MKTTRQRILEYIRVQRVATALEIGRTLQMTGANARHHLGILQIEGLISQVGTRPASGKGRPHKLYSLAEPILGHNLDQLARALLEMWVDDLPSEERTEFYARLAQKLLTNTATGQAGTGARSSDERRLAGTHPTQRLNQAVALLNELHYVARWEAHALGPRIWLGHCPYLALLPDHPEICQFDGNFLGGLVGAGVTQTARRSRDARGNIHCLFLVKK
jgi:predicted ArsR family transcriptional regulator